MSRRQKYQDPACFKLGDLKATFVAQSTPCKVRVKGGKTKLLAWVSSDCDFIISSCGVLDDIWLVSLARKKSRLNSRQSVTDLRQLNSFLKTGIERRLLNVCSDECGYLHLLKSRSWVCTLGKPRLAASYPFPFPGEILWRTARSLRPPPGVPQ